jgi:hypothetical protein
MNYVNLLGAREAHNFSEEPPIDTRLFSERDDMRRFIRPSPRLFQTADDETKFTRSMLDEIENNTFQSADAQAEDNLHHSLGRLHEGLVPLFQEASCVVGIKATRPAAAAASKNGMAGTK